MSLRDFCGLWLDNPPTELIGSIEHLRPTDFLRLGPTDWHTALRRPSEKPKNNKETFFLKEDDTQGRILKSHKNTYKLDWILKLFKPSNHQEQDPVHWRDQLLW